MGRPDTKPWRWSALRGYCSRGAPQALPADLATVADDVMLVDGTLGQRRPSTIAHTLTSGPTTTINYLQVHRPISASSGFIAPELWAFSYPASVFTIHRHSTVSGLWTGVAPTDTPSADGTQVDALTFNNKFYVTYQSNVNRLHLWDGTAFRRVGLAASGVGSIADTGAGAYAATARYYRFSQRTKVGSDIVNESELSAALSFTPSGSGTAARISKPTTIESATHWVVWGLIGSVGDVYDQYEFLAETAVGTAYYDDTVNPSAYDGDAPAPLGMHEPPVSVKYLLVDANRLLMAGAWGLTEKKSRVSFTRPLGASDIGDDETVANTTVLQGWIDVGNGDGDEIQGMGGPIDGIIYVFKSRHIYQLIPTGIDTVPYREGELVSSSVGLNPVVLFPHRTIVLGENELYFMGKAGAYRLSPFTGLEFLGEDIADARGAGPLCSAAAFDSLLRVIVWLDVTNKWLHVFTPHLAQRTAIGWRGGWTKWRPTAFDTPASLVMFEPSGGLNTRYLMMGGSHLTVAKLEYFSQTGADDAGGSYSPTITSRPFLAESGSHSLSFAHPILEAECQVNARPTIAYVLDYGRETRTATAPSLAAEGSETRTSVVVEGLEATDARAVQVRVTWDTDHTKVIDAVVMPHKVQEPA